MINATVNEKIFDHEHLVSLIQNIYEPLYVVKHNQTAQIGLMPYAVYAESTDLPLSLLGILPAVYQQMLGDKNFLTTHKAQYPYVVGEMANGIATAKMVIAAVQAGMVGFFGAAGLDPKIVEENIHNIQTQLNSPHAWGSNLIHSPHEPHFEEAVVDLYLRRQVQRVSASAYMAVNPYIVQYACSGLRLDQTGRIQRQNYVLAKISRPEVAKQFMSPAPGEILEHLKQQGKLTQEEVMLAAHIPLAEDITVEADSGGHTDNRPLNALFPTIQTLAQQLTEKYQYISPIRIGAAGGLGTPSAIASAFTLGAAYVLTGSINQAAVESGLSEEGRKMLADAGIADVIMAPAADMFELGVKLQVLKRGTFFGGRATKLYELYSHYNSLEEIPQDEKVKLEKQIFCMPIADVWEKTRQFFARRDPQQLVRAEQNPKHRMALVFRWYLGLSSQWAIQGNIERKMDYQIWCGPAMGAFNHWVAGTYLADIQNRTVAQIGLNLLIGASISIRLQQLRSYGMEMSHISYVPQNISLPL